MEIVVRSFELECIKHGETPQIVSFSGETIS